MTREEYKKHVEERLEHMQRDAEQRAARYIQEPPPEADDVAEGVIAWVIVLMVIFAFSALCVTVCIAAGWLFRD
jgi:hypothetical protein